jgi:ATP-dependent Lhr-like helicase
MAAADAPTVFDRAAALVRHGDRVGLGSGRAATRFLEALAAREIRVVETARLSPLAFPIWAEQIQSRLTTQGWLERITEMARELEGEAGR